MTTVMSATQTLERNDQTGLSDSTQSSSASAEKYRLDKFDDRPILLYKYRGGLQTSSQKDLCAWIDKGGFCYSSARAALDIRRLCACAIHDPESDFGVHDYYECDRSFESGRQTIAYCCSGQRPALSAPCLLSFADSSNDYTFANYLTDEKLRVTKKPIPRYTSYIDIKRHDLYLPEEKHEYANFPNFDSNLASIKVPSLPYWSRLLLGNYQHLYIVSPESSPTSSTVDDDSRRTSPTSTWSPESSDEARLGAMQEESQSQ